MKIITKDFFSDEEMKYIDESRDFVSSLQTHEIVNLFHDNIYNIFDMDEEIPMFMYSSMPILCLNSIHVRTEII